MIDDMVYDVTEFSNEHPGGQMPLKNFAGKSCSCWYHTFLIWDEVTEYSISGQFHQIHSQTTLQRHGGLCVGWTENVMNPFEKPKPKSMRPLWSRQF